MIRSMTGYGRSTGEYQGINYSIEIKSLNSRMADMRLKVPTNFKSKELDLRKLVLDKLKRGKVDMVVNALSSQLSDNQLNIGLIQQYYDQLRQFTDRNQLAGQDYIQAILRIPNVLQSDENEIDDDEWAFVENLTNEALGQIDNFRCIEGQAMGNDMLTRVQNIELMLKEIPTHEDKRRADLIAKMNRSLEEGIAKEMIDPNRFEQELIYYLEKLDLHEEKIRLEQHCLYFREAMNDDEDSGKKLNFISQEMGREINTIGSKAQFTAIQQIVVNMKVELDQIKEQMSNIL